MDQSKVSQLEGFLQQNGMLLCNANPYFPALEDVGGDWEAMMSLQKRNRVFTCKVYRKRTTYLSPKLYFCLKACRKPPSPSGNASQLLELFRGYGGCDTAEAKRLLSWDTKRFTETINWLQQNLLVTVLGEGKQLNQNWSAYLWGTAQQWEVEWQKNVSADELRACVMEPESARSDTYSLLSPHLSAKEIDRLLLG